MLDWLSARIYRYQRFEQRLRELQGEVMVLLRDRHDLKLYLAETLEKLMTEFPDARWEASPLFTPGHAGLKPDFIVLTLAEAREEGMSYHYIVEHNGDIVQMVSEEHSAVNAGLSTGHAPWWGFVNTKQNPDFVCFRILLITEDGKLSPEQIAHSFVLIADLCNRHRIVKSEADQFGGITGVESLDPFYHRDNSKNFPYSALVDYLSTGVLPVEKSKESSKAENELKENPEKLSKLDDAEEPEVKAPARKRTTK
jgi:hypothetical protein